MAGGIGPWEIYWTRMWDQGREMELGPKGREFVWLHFGQFLETGGGPEDLDPADAWEGPY